MFSGSVILLFLIGQSGIAPAAVAIMEPVPIIRDASPLPSRAIMSVAETVPRHPTTTAETIGISAAAARTETELAINALVRAERIRVLLNALRTFDAGRYQQAEAAADQLLKSDPWDTMALTIAGASRIRLNDPAGAIARFEIYVRYHPLEAMGHFYLGLALHLAGNRERAIESYWTALLLDPGLQAARANMNLLTAP